MRKTKATATWFAVVMISIFPAAGQFSSSIQGLVTDASGAVVPDAKVTVLNTATGVSRTTPTSSAGLYRVLDLGPGEYRVSKSPLDGCKRWREGPGLAHKTDAVTQLRPGRSKRLEPNAQSTI